MKNELYGEMYEKYEEGFSLAEVGRMYGVTRQSVFSGFKCRNYEMRKKKELPFQIYDGIKFTKRNHGYFARTDGDRGLMHRYVWEKHNQPIPCGHDLHHRNHDKTDNRIENLEIYTKSEHARKFNIGHNQFTNEINR